MKKKEINEVATARVLTLISKNYVKNKVMVHEVCCNSSLKSLSRGKRKCKLKERVVEFTAEMIVCM